MFNLFKKKKGNSLSIGSLLKTDMHSHLIPGIDDGSPDIQTSLKLIKGLYDMGYKKLVLTPHIMKGVYSNESKDIKNRLNQLKYALPRGLDITLEASAEYFMDMHLEKLIKENDILSFGIQKYVLIEMSFAAPSPNVDEIIFSLQTKGYQPLLAHPERYGYWHGRKDKFDDLLDKGVLFQVNLLSLLGYYGQGVKHFAEYLLKSRKVSFLGTDLHHAKHLKQLQDFRVSPHIFELLNEKEWGNRGLATSD